MRSQLTTGRHDLSDLLMKHSHYIMHTGTTNYTDLEDILNKTQWNLYIPDTNGAKESVYIVRWPHFRDRKRTTRGRGAKESLYRWPHFRDRKRTTRAGKRCQRCPQFGGVLIEGFYSTLSTNGLKYAHPLTCQVTVPLLHRLP